jgi:predicted double-glycine peptidase
LKEIWNNQNHKLERFIVVWNNEEHYILNTNLVKMLIQKEGNSNNYLNPYGIIPIATLWLETVDIWGDPQYRLVEHYVANSLTNVWKNYNEFFHIGGIPVLSNVDINNITNKGNNKIRPVTIPGEGGEPLTLNYAAGNEKKLQISPDVILNLGSDLNQQPNFRFETPQSNLELIQNLIDWDIKKNLSDYNIPRNAFSTETTPESGYSKMVSEMEVINARKKHLLPCLAMENELFEVVKVLLEYKYNVKFPTGSTLKVDYVEYEYPRSPAERAQEIDINIKYNIKSPVDYIMEDNPELSEEEAEDIYKYNMQMNKLNENESKEISLKFEEDNIIEFPELRQSYDLAGGASCLQGVLLYYGENANENDFNITSYNDFENIATARGFTTISRLWSIDNIKGCIDSKTPVIIGIQVYSNLQDIDYKITNDNLHYVVAIGYDDFNFIFEDPASLGLATLNYEELEKRWHFIDNGVEIINWGLAVYGNPRYFRNKTVAIG